MSQSLSPSPAPSAREPPSTTATDPDIAISSSTSSTMAAGMAVMWCVLTCGERHHTAPEGRRTYSDFRNSTK
jgi:hypothetical protein